MVPHRDWLSASKGSRPGQSLLGESPKTGDTPATASMTLRLVGVALRLLADREQSSFSSATPGVPASGTLAGEENIRLLNR